MKSPRNSGTGADVGTAPPPPADRHRGAATGVEPVIVIPTVDELRETRRCLSEQAGLDIQRYATLLQPAAGGQAATYVSKPLLPKPLPPPFAPAGLEPESAQV